jgi:hypothetical protein
MRSEGTVTIVRCATCRRSGDLALFDGRFWCARCQAWATLETEVVRQTVLVGDGATAHLARDPGTPPARQALRIPPGWHVGYSEFYEEEPTPDWPTPNDLFQAAHEHRSRVVDLTWYRPEGDESPYRITAWDPNRPAGHLHDSRHERREEAVAELERVLERVVRGKF